MLSPLHLPSLGALCLTGHLLSLGDLYLPGRLPTQVPHRLASLPMAPFLHNRSEASRRGGGRLEARPDGKPLHHLSPPNPAAKIVIPNRKGRGGGGGQRRTGGRRTEISEVRLERRSGCDLAKPSELRSQIWREGGGPGWGAPGIASEGARAAFARCRYYLARSRYFLGGRRSSRSSFRNKRASRQTISCPVNCDGLIIRPDSDHQRVRLA
jgi:hypothetical protein